MKIVLVFPPFYLESMYNLPPLGLINIATALQGPAHTIALLDFALALREKALKMGRRIYDDCAERILGEEPDLVAISAQCTTFPAVIQISQRIKSAGPNVKIVLGGHTVSSVDYCTLERYPFVDAVVRGEGEWSFSGLVQSYASGGMGEKVRGVTWRRGKEIFRNEDRPLIPRLDDLPLPDYGLAPPFSRYRDACELPRSIATLEVGRGCPHRCIYCSQSVMWQRQSRTFSVERLVTEMDLLHRRFGAECFLLAYDQFTARRDFVESFCRRVMEAGLSGIPWYCISRLDSVDPPLLRLMREAGCESMCYGIDSGSERTLAFIRKKIDRGILRKRVQETAEEGIVPTLSFVIGFPEERKEDLDDTLRLALQSGIIGNNNPLIQLLTVLPGTDLQAKYGDRLILEVDTYFSLGLEFHHGRRLPTDEALIDSSRDLFSAFYNLPSPSRPLEELNLIAGYFPLMVRYYPKSFLLLSLELETSPSDLFLQWLRWVKERLGKGTLSLSQEECLLHFGSFTTEALSGRDTLRLEHLPAVLSYETLCMGAEGGIERRGAFDLDVHHLRAFRPSGKRKVLTAEFDFDLQPVIDDLKAGREIEKYPREKTYLVFRQEGDTLDISSINEFGWDFIRLSDGNPPLEELSRRLYPLHGGEMGREEFLNECGEALQSLIQMGILDPPSEGPSSSDSSPGSDRKGERS